MTQIYRLTDSGDLKNTTGMEIDETTLLTTKSMDMGNDGVLRANEFDEITSIATQMSSRQSELVVDGHFIEPSAIASLAGKGNGIDNYIDTVTECSTIGWKISVTFKYDASLSNSSIFSLYYKHSDPRMLGTDFYRLGLTNDTGSLVFVFAYNNGPVPIFPSSRTLTSYVVDGGIYRVTYDGAILQLFAGDGAGLLIYSTAASVAHLPRRAVPLYAHLYYWLDGRIVRANTLSNYSQNTIYKYTISGSIVDETFEINSGTDTITGDYGTERTVEGDLTDFWVESDL